MHPQACHHQLGEIWFKYRKGFYSEKEFLRDIKSPLDENIDYLILSGQLNQLADLATSIGDGDWENDAGLKLDALHFNSGGGIE
ncbi:hypothetical protein IC620_16140 [Hazenella sp. IB182357]|uniref:Uncharacterized protein n=1 Tax=Polycladospora coralii TaxID=2771432 RepID=A0A926RUF5_9BACL|nr:hypothetical protein [Polycladospora coralii]MBD1373875.1 hypothetical protein [Polycladospora coralii]